MKNHVVARWSAVPLGRIDHLAVQEWVSQLGQTLSPSTVGKCHNLLSLVLAAALKDRLIGANPAEGVHLPTSRKKDTDDQVVTPDVVAKKILPGVPNRYRALVALAAGTGLRWGECVGLRWDAVDLDTKCVRVIRVAVEVAGTVTAKPFPKSRAGRRPVPLPPLVVNLLTQHRDAYPPGPAGDVFTNSTGGPLRRTLFRSRVWRPALVEAGLLGRVDHLGEDGHRATWNTKDGREINSDHPTRSAAVREIVRHADGGLRFHDLRHSYATWLVSSGVPVNDVQKVMGHEQASTTLNRYTHGSDDRDARVRKALDDFSLTFEPQEDPE